MTMKNFLIATLLLSSSTVFGQVSKKVVLEHYTNTLCGNCSFQNPKIISNLEKNPEVLHLTIHPSRPYTACILNKHNTAEQDARTKDYGIFGSTPRLVVQGEVVNRNADYGSSAIFTSHKEQTSPASISVKQEKTNSTIKLEITITTEAEHSLGKLTLFAALAEDTIFYNAPNGEKEHYNVFRKTIFDQAPEFDLPATVGESVVLTASSEAHKDWDFDRIMSVIMVQEKDNKKVVQSEATTASQNDVIPVGVNERTTASTFSVFPNPVSQGVLNLTKTNDYGIYNLNGKELLNARSVNAIDVSNLPTGLYIVKAASGETKKFSIE